MNVANILNECFANALMDENTEENVCFIDNALFSWQY